MEKIDMISWILGGGFGVIFGLMVVMWYSLNSRFERLENRIENLDEKVSDIDRRLEGIFLRLTSMK